MDNARVDELQALLDDAAKRHRLPGAAVAVLDGDEVIEAATGTTNRNTGVEVATDTLFQIGSITKVYTTTLVMQLVDEELVELDEPVGKYLPELRFADESATEAITVRHLLCHTSGVDGDFFEDTGRGDDCVEKYVAACSQLPQIARPGSLFSYCNAGFTVAGRLIERVTGKIWDAVLKEKLLSPLGVTKTVTLPEEALLQRVAAGHIVNPADPDGETILTPMWMLPRSCGPAGVIVASARDVISFARMHLDRGVAADGTRVLSVEGARAMQQEQVALPDRFSTATSWGLGWMLFDWKGRGLIGHDGATAGQTAFLRVAPEERFAVALVTNGATGLPVYRDLFTELFGNKGFELPDPPEPGAGVDFDPRALEGVYERVNITSTIESVDGGLVASVRFGGILASIEPPVEEIPLRPVDPTTFLIRYPGEEEDTPLVFFDFDDSGRPRYIHSGGRASRRHTERVS